MSKGANDVFALVIIFLSNDWQPKHVTINLFGATKTIGQALAKSLTELLDKYGLRKKNIAYVKDEGSNLNAMTNVLKSIVKCDSLGIEESFQGTCFGHAFSKACQYGTIEEKVYKNLKYVSIKSPQVDLQKCITRPKNFGKGKQEWNKVCLKLEFDSKN
jgi:hypothetical protein